MYFFADAGTSHVGQALHYNLYSVKFSIWSATHADKMGKHLRNLRQPNQLGQNQVPPAVGVQKANFEYLLQSVGVQCSLVLICFGAL